MESLYDFYFMKKILFVVLNFRNRIKSNYVLNILKIDI